MTISTVLFDYSGVLTTSIDLPLVDVTYDPYLLRAEMARAQSIHHEDPWHKLERGEGSLEDYLDDLESRVPGARALFETDSPTNLIGVLQLRDDRLRLAADLKAADYRVGVVTNNVAEWQPLWRPRLPGGLFEVIIDSAYVGCRKPEPAIYQLAMNMLGLDDPSEVVFIDDFESNVEGAEAVGMVGLHCGPDTDLGAELAIHIGDSLSKRSRLPAGRRRRRN